MKVIFKFQTLFVILHHQLKFNEKMPFAEFKLDTVMLEQECERTYVTGKFSCLEGYFHLKRTIGYYLVQIFVPSLFCISCSVGSYWIKLQVAPARVFLASATILTLMQQMSAANRVVPKVSYVKVPIIHFGATWQLFACGEVLLKSTDGLKLESFRHSTCG